MSLPAHELRHIRERARNQREYDELVARRVAGEPLQYVVARWGFRTLELYVDRRVLVPRPETEMVLEYALKAVPAPVLAVDLGTGSGAIALSIAVEVPGALVWATDASADALAVARANLSGLGKPAQRVRVVEGDWYGALPPELRGRVDLIVSNPPYVAAHEKLPAEVIDWEPRRALIAGPTGLEAIETVVGGAREWLAVGGALVVEIAPHQAGAARELAASAGFADVSIEKDLTGRDRVLVAR